MARKIILLDAPSNLGLRPPAEGVVPGCYKLPWALRDRSLLSTLGAEDGGSLVPPRYDPVYKPGEGDRNAEAIASFSARLADRLAALRRSDTLVVVLGGDCSILIGAMLSLKRHGRYGLVFLDAHSDFRHPQNASAIGAAAGEDLAIVTGRGDARLIAMENLGPYVCAEDVHIVGVRPFDTYLRELAATQMKVMTSLELSARASGALAEVLETVTRETDGFWIHLDLDVVDAAEMPAVDSPEAQGLSFGALSRLLSGLLASPKCVGMELTIYDPDLDSEGLCAERIVACLAEAFAALTAA